MLAFAKAQKFRPAATIQLVQKYQILKKLLTDNSASGYSFALCCCYWYAYDFIRIIYCEQFYIYNFIFTQEYS